MKPSLQKLHKFFKLESERGYDNRAVVGGLDRILGNWEAEARAENLPDDLVQAVIARLRAYPKLSPNSRAEILEGLWRRIQREETSELSPLQPPPAEMEAEKRGESSPGESKIHPAKASQPFTGQRKKIPGPRGGPVSSDIKSSPAVEGPSAALNAPVTVLPGVGPRHGQTLARLGLFSLGDMLHFFPRRYDDYTLIKPIHRLVYGEEVTVIGKVESVQVRPIRNGRAQVVEAVLSDVSGVLRISWFNQPWIAKRLRSGMYVVLQGKIDQYLGRPVMNNPEWEPLEQNNLHANRIVPVYPLTANITQRWLRNLMRQVVEYWAPRVQDMLPEQIRLSAELVDLSTALLNIHFPTSWEKNANARRRLAFDEIFLLQLGVLQQKRSWQEREARSFIFEDVWLAVQIATLPFELTSAQQRVIQDIRADLASGRPMNRLLQGDVGSGKTILAALAIAIIARQGSQTALMAPTSILAEQHYQNLLKILCHPRKAPAETSPVASSNDPIEQEIPILEEAQIRLMIGATPEAEKRLIREGLLSGEIKVVVGTHALIEDPVIFNDLQLAIVDEQHRFGVEQRAALRAKGDRCHLLVMTATPIPRSLALTIYGDLDLSVMDEMPPGRQIVETQIFFPRERERAYAMIRRQVEMGHQAFIIYPLVEEGENNDAKAAVEEHFRLQQEIFPDLKLGLLHGRLKPEEKETVMAHFRDGEIQALVSTSVVEVGVDVPNATIMVIEGANRFGLAQLHQLRGRVGRGEAKAYCILIPETPDSAENERLAAMVATNDGFALAEYDLEQRGPGQFMGTRQSGYHSDLRLASLTDVHLIEQARRLAQSLFNEDPELHKEEHHQLAAVLASSWGEEKGDIS